jgi:hypothetical protein
MGVSNHKVNKRSKGYNEHNNSIFGPDGSTEVSKVLASKHQRGKSLAEPSLLNSSFIPMRNQSLLEDNSLQAVGMQPA